MNNLISGMSDHQLEEHIIGKQWHVVRNEDWDWDGVYPIVTGTEIESILYASDDPDELGVEFDELHDCYCYK